MFRNFIFTFKSKSGYKWREMVENVAFFRCSKSRVGLFTSSENSLKLGIPATGAHLRHLISTWLGTLLWLAFRFASFQIDPLPSPLRKIDPILLSCKTQFSLVSVNFVCNRFGGKMEQNASRRDHDRNFRAKTVRLSCVNKWFSKSRIYSGDLARVAGVIGEGAREK